MEKPKFTATRLAGIESEVNRAAKRNEGAEVKVLFCKIIVPIRLAKSS